MNFPTTHLPFQELQLRVLLRRSKAIYAKFLFP